MNFLNKLELALSVLNEGILPDRVQDLDIVNTPVEILADAVEENGGRPEDLKYICNKMIHLLDTNPIDLSNQVEEIRVFISSDDVHGFSADYKLDELAGSLEELMNFSQLLHRDGIFIDEINDDDGFFRSIEHITDVLIKHNDKSIKSLFGTLQSNMPNVAQQIKSDVLKKLQVRKDVAKKLTKIVDIILPRIDWAVSESISEGILPDRVQDLDVVNTPVEILADAVEENGGKIEDLKYITLQTLESLKLRLDQLTTAAVDDDEIDHQSVGLINNVIKRAGTTFDVDDPTINDMFTDDVFENRTDFKRDFINLFTYRAEFGVDFLERMLKRAKANEIYVPDQLLTAAKRFAAIANMAVDRLNGIATIIMPRVNWSVRESISEGILPDRVQDLDVVNTPLEILADAVEENGGKPEDLKHITLLTLDAFKQRLLDFEPMGTELYKQHQGGEIPDGLILRDIGYYLGNMYHLLDTYDETNSNVTSDEAIVIGYDTFEYPNAYRDGIVESVINIVNSEINVIQRALEYADNYNIDVPSEVSRAVEEAVKLLKNIARRFRDISNIILPRMNW